MFQTCYNLPHSIPPLQHSLLRLITKHRNMDTTLVTTSERTISLIHDETHSSKNTNMQIRLLVIIMLPPCPPSPRPQTN